MEIKTIQKIFAKFGDLLDSGLGSDVIIEVGKESNIKKFHVHSIVLIAVSPYFHTAFSSTWVNRVNGNIHFEKPNISPNTFEIILKFIYKADLDLNRQKTSDICNLIKASDELNIDILNEHILEFVSQNSRKLLNEDPVQILQVVFQLDIFSNLRDTFLQIICKNPEKLMNFSNFHSINKYILIQLLKRDDLNMEEIKIWYHLLDWASFNIQDKLNINEIEKWNSGDFALLKDEIKDFIPYIRWFQISGKDFWYNIKPFKDALPDDLYDNLLGYYIDKSVKLTSLTILPQRNNPSVKQIHKGSAKMSKKAPMSMSKKVPTSKSRKIVVI
ncbi:BTB/POZ protein [Glomus cerebriforme]|uniref:BTB/POZ protein n=1 Tax=Glomus cerebriforme TaxID=658196 RepID=A0A397SBQ5_9GLOM|nr:BTB/POZ protein [Glomus cerebriforme]RIA95823.1 BTB/POZ protein [Glomus cerebriforme]